MAYRELGMVEVREIVRRWLARDSIRAIARATGMDRKTIAEYVRAAVAVGVEQDGPPLTEAQVAAIVGAQRPGRPTNMTVPSPEIEALRCQGSPNFPQVWSLKIPHPRVTWWWPRPA